MDSRLGTSVQPGHTYIHTQRETDSITNTSSPSTIHSILERTRRLHKPSTTSSLTLKYPPWYGVSGGPNIATCQRYRSSSFGKVTTNPSTGSLCRLLNSPPNLCKEVEAGVAMLAVLLAFLLVWFDTHKRLFEKKGALRLTVTNCQRSWNVERMPSAKDKSKHCCQLGAISLPITSL